MTINEAALCHVAVLTNMLGQLTQIKAQMETERPKNMSLPTYQKAISDIGAQHAALAFAVSILSHAYGKPANVIEGTVLASGNGTATVVGGQDTGVNMDDLPPVGHA